MVFITVIKNFAWMSDSYIPGMKLTEYPHLKNAARSKDTHGRDSLTP